MLETAGTTGEIEKDLFHSTGDQGLKVIHSSHHNWLSMHNTKWYLAFPLSIYYLQFPRGLTPENKAYDKFFLKIT